MVSDSFPIRLQYQVHVVGHHHPGVQIVFMPSPLAMEQRFRKYVRYSRIGQPSLSRIEAIQLSILQQEDPARIWIAREQLWCGPRKSTRQPPADKHDGILRNPMWKSSSPEHDSSSPAARPPALPEKCVPDYASLRKCRNSSGRLKACATFSELSIPRICKTNR